MSLKEKLRVVAVCVALGLGVLSGTPMRPDEIEELMHQMNQPTIAHALPSDEADGDAPPTARQDGDT